MTQMAIRLRGRFEVKIKRNMTLKLSKYNSHKNSKIFPKENLTWQKRNWNGSTLREVV